MSEYHDTKAAYDVYGECPLSFPSRNRRDGIHALLPDRMITAAERMEVEEEGATRRSVPKAWEAREQVHM